MAKRWIDIMWVKRVLASKTECSGCAACVCICPKKAITMQTDSFGFLYPVIDEKSCVHCNLCRNTCPMHNSAVNFPRSSYAGINQNKAQKMISSSGGAFSAIASFILKEKGTVFGAALFYDKGKLWLEHKGIDSIEELYMLQGSKYIQSSAEDAYAKVKKLLGKSVKVLFSGTPCQVAGLKAYLQKDYDNLYTIDLICHGVPSLKWFQESIKIKERKNKARVMNLKFRDKEKGWMNGSIQYEKDNGSTEFKPYNWNTESYYNLFLQSETFRESCYSCPFAKIERISDITIGDFWGFGEEYPQESIEKAEGISLNEGISGILVNTKKGESLINLINEQEIWKYAVRYKNIAKHNKQLIRPSKAGRNRKYILFAWRLGKYQMVELFLNLKNVVLGFFKIRRDDI